MNNYIIIISVLFINTGIIKSQTNTNKIINMETIKKIQDYNLKYPYELPTLEYGYNELEPYIDTKTMDIHLNKHHAAYINNLNAALKDGNFDKLSLFDLFDNISDLPVSIRNNGGGHFNHVLFWRILSPEGTKTKPAGKLLEAINNQFGSFEKFKEDFENAAKTRFGSGWAWLSIDKDNKLFISSTANQDNPLMNIADKKGFPILGIDVWEHAYYLNYQNRRPDYIENFWKIVNWNEVERLYNIFTE